MISNIKYSGSGIGYRKEIKKDILQNKDSIDFLEIITENFMDHLYALDVLSELSDQFKIIPHGINLSIGSPNLDMTNLTKIKEICNISKAPYYSEHLCITKVPGISTGHLTPIRYTEKNFKIARDNVNLIQDYLGIPLILENITYGFQLPNNSMSQEEFFHKIVEQTNCGILLDVTNVHTNAHTHNFDPYEFIDNMPLSSVVQIHIAGGVYTNNKLIDSHDQSVEKMSWDLLKYIAKKIQIKGVILERDDNFPEDFNVLLKEIEKARQIIRD